jgi:hypothetical protein
MLMRRFVISVCKVALMGTLLERRVASPEDAAHGKRVVEVFSAGLW